MKNSLSVFLFLTLSISSSAQMLSQDWATELTNDAGAAYEELNAVMAHENGTIVAGKSTSSLGYDMYVASYNNNAEPVWEKYVDTPNNSEFTHILADDAGNYYLLGFEIFAQFYDRGVHLLKINSTGEILWQTTYLGPQNIGAWAKDIALHNGTISICGIEDQPDGFSSGFVARFSADGALLWDGDFNPGLGNELTSLTVTPDGSLTAVGYADGEYSLYAIQYDADGNINWTFPDTFSGDDEIWFTDIVSDESGNLYTMVTAETGFFEQTVFTQKRTDDFDLVWEHPFNSGELNEGLSLALGSDASVYSFIREDVSFDFFARVIKLDDSGNEVFNIQEDFGNGTEFEKAAIGPDDRIYLGLESSDSWGITSVDSDGTFIESVTYDQSQIDYLFDLSPYENRLVVLGRQAQGFNSTLINLAASDLAEEYFITTSGEPMPDARPGKIVARGSEVWLSTYGYSGQEGTFTINKLDPSGNVEWEHSVTHPSVYPEFLRLQPDGNGNITGLYHNGLGLMEGHYGLMKLDTDGNEIFDVYVDDSDEYQTTALCVDDAGNSYISGFHHGTKLMYVARYDANGNLEWQVDYQSPSPTAPFSRPFEMQYTDQGKIVIAASHKGANNDNDLHLFQYADDGTLEWHENVIEQNGNLTSLLNMQIEENGDIYVFGSSGFGYVAAKFTNEGTSDWTYAGQLGFSQAPRSMTRDNAGNVYLCFSSSTAAIFRKLDPFGNLITEQTVATNSTGAFYYPEACEIIDDRLVVLGDHLYAQHGTVSIQMVLSNALEPLHIAIDSTATAEIYSSTIDENGNFYGAYMTGYLSGGKGARTAIVKKFSLTSLGIHHRQAEPIDVTIFPNPTRRDFEVKINSAQSGSIQVSVIDIHGRLIHRYPPDHQTGAAAAKRYTLPPGLASGVYLIEFKSETNKAVKRVVVE